MYLITQEYKYYENTSQYTFAIVKLSATYRVANVWAGVNYFTLFVNIGGQRRRSYWASYTTLNNDDDDEQ